jgi:hypothetical protein
MAKALYGHIGGPDPRLLTELATLRRRVAELEAEMARLRAENDALVIVSEDLLTIDVAAVEPALA